MKRAAHPLFLGIDFAPDSAAAVLLDIDRRAVVARATTAMPNVLPGDDDAARDRCFEALRRVARECLRAIADESRAVRGLGISANDAGSRAAIDESLRAEEVSAGPTLLPHDAAEWLGLHESRSREDVIVAPDEPREVLFALGCGATKESVAAVRFDPLACVVASAFPSLVDPDGLLVMHSDTRGDAYVEWSPRTGESLLDEFRVGFSTADDLDLSRLDAAAESAPIGAHGIVVLPWFDAAASDPRAAAAVLGIVPGRFRASLVHRAAIEAIGYAIGSGIDRMRALGCGVDLVRLSGPGSESALRRRVLAAITETRVSAITEPHLVARGAAIAAAASWFSATGDDVPVSELAFELAPTTSEIVEPVAEDVRAYRRWAETFQASARRLAGASRMRRDTGELEKRDARGRRQGRLFEP